MEEHGAIRSILTTVKEEVRDKTNPCLSTDTASTTTTWTLCDCWSKGHEAEGEDEGERTHRVTVDVTNSIMLGRARRGGSLFIIICRVIISWRFAPLTRNPNLIMSTARSTDISSVLKKNRRFLAHSGKACYEAQAWHWFLGSSWSPGVFI